MTLMRRFSPLMLLMISINGMVGSAWLFAPLYAAKIAGPAALIAWLLGGFGTLLIALTFAEIAVLFPVTGGSAYLPNVSHGTLVSFMMSFIAWLSALTMAPIEVQSILQYASVYFASLMQTSHGIPILSTIGLLWAAGLMLLFCVINIASFKGLERFNTVLFFFKIAVILLTILCLFKTHYINENFSGTWTALYTGSGWHAILTAVSTGGIAFAFTGFKHGLELAGEAKNETVSIPLAMIGSVAICLLLYLGLQVAFIAALHPAQLSHGWQHITFRGDAGPFAGLALSLGLIWLVKLLYLDAAISPGGAGLIYVTSTARILYTMSQLGFMPSCLTRVNRQGFPYTAILFNFVLGMFLFLPFPGWQAMVSFLVSGMVLSYAMGPITLMCLRLDAPKKVRHFRLPAAPVLSFAAFYFCNLLSFWTGWETMSKLAIALTIGLLMFYYADRKGSIQRTPSCLSSASWMLPYFIGLVCLSYLGTFGGGHGVLRFGWDFLVIAVFSLVIFTLALYCRSPLLMKQSRLRQ